jgi:glycosidase
MGVLLQGFYKLPPNRAVPSPADGDASIPWWWDHLASQANALCLAGFTAVWLPPVLKTNVGSKSGADGYGPFDDYDIGSKHQKGSLETRFGSREQLQRCVAILRANGLDVYLDMVEHHRIGDTTPFVFRYLSASGKPDIGRFPKDPLNFIPQVPRDPDLGGPPKDDFPFGRELAPINARPKHYVSDNLIAASDWLTRALDVQGYRLDDVKGLSTDFLLPFLTSKSMRGKFAVGEFFDGNRQLVENWISNPHGMQGRSSAFDFPLKFMLNAMCNGAGRFNMAMLDHAGLAGIDPVHAVTFVENHDTDLNNNKIITNKILGYAYILTSEGYPCVYYRDYSTDMGCFGLKPKIDNLIWIHEKLAAGPTQQRFLDFNLIAYERLGGPHLLVGLNNDPNGPRTITVATGFGAHVPLHDYTGHSNDVTTDDNGSVTITVPRNANGLGYVCYSRAGMGGGFDVTTRAVTQDFEGAADLDISPATAGTAVTVSRVWCNVGSEVKAVLAPDKSDWTAATSITLDILAPDNSVRASLTVKRDTPTGTALQTTASQTGFHTLRLTASGTPETNAAPKYTLSATYTSEPVFQPVVQAAAHNVKGLWSPVFKMSNVAVHAHLLSTGKVLYWGRRAKPGDTVFASLNEHETHPFIWDPATRTSTPTPQPKDQAGNNINLFCSGHTILADGRVMVTGGHLFDSEGIKQSTIYDPQSNSWSAGPLMNDGRWYPTAVTLADGGVLVCSGSFTTGTPQPPPNNMPILTNMIPQVWHNGPWQSLTNFVGLPLYPRMHVAPDGRVFMSGTNAESFFFDTRNQGTWSPSAVRHAGNRDYCPSVMYDVGKIVYIGGGNDEGTGLPSNIVEVIDLNKNPPAWRVVQAMHFRRRQHNATILPDGTVLVTGGTQGAGFDDLDPGKPVHTAELWDPVSEQWTVLGDEQVDRCYHSTAVLLPDATVLSAGGGEYQPVASIIASNDPKDSHADGQIFSPPYLFKGKRPVITSAPTSVRHGQAFDVGTDTPEQIKKVSLVRLASVTHSFDQNQRINFLVPTPKAGAITVTTPPNGNVCPPGHYMLFLLNEALVPSVARIIKIEALPTATAAAVTRPALHVIGSAEMDAEMTARAGRPPVVVGLTSMCPYGLAACWGGAYSALTELSGVESVRPVADAKHSVAFVYLDNDGLPDVEDWPAEFARAANGSYGWRGVEVTLQGGIEKADGQWMLSADASRPAVALAPLQPGAKVQLDMENGVPRPLPEAEKQAYANLVGRAQGTPGQSVTVTGPLKKTDAGYVLEVRKFD